MADIIRFPRPDDEYDSTRDFLQDTILRLEEEGVESVLIAGKTKDGQVITGYYKCNFGLRQELCGHIQCDIIDQMIRANPERYGG
jgi:hypothetical protein